MERKIGEVFNIYNQQFVPVEKHDMCNGCYFLGQTDRPCDSDEITHHLGDCKRVIFKEIV